MTITRIIDGKETMIELTWSECQYIYNEWQKECDIEDLSDFAEEQNVKVTRKMLEAVQNEYRKIIDWNSDIDETKRYAAQMAIDTVLDIFEVERG